MMEVFIPVLCVVAGAAVEWFFTRKKNKAETDKVELDLIQMWKGIADDLREEINELTKKCGLLSEQVEIFRRENASLKEELKKFERMLKEKMS